MRLAGITLAVLALWGVVLLLAGAAGAQQGHPGAESGVPDLPAGEGVIHGRVVHPEAPERAAGIRVALYALSKTGPGLRGAVTDDQGGFRFEGIFRQHFIVKGRNRDTAWYAMLDGDWPGVKEDLERWLYSGEELSLTRLTQTRQARARAPSSV